MGSAVLLVISEDFHRGHFFSDPVGHAAARILHIWSLQLGASLHAFLTFTSRQLCSCVKMLVFLLYFFNPQLCAV